MTTQNVNDIKAVEDKFIDALGSGKSATRHMLAMFQSVVVSRDTTVLARAIKRAEAKGDSAAAGIVRFVTSQVFPGAKVRKAKDAKAAPSIVIKGINSDDDVLARLEDAIERKLSIRHATFRKVVKGEEASGVKPTFDPKAWAERQVKARDKSEIDQMIAALQAARKAAK